MSAVPINLALELAVNHLRAGRLVETEAICRRIISQQPNNYDALHLLGSVAYQVRRFDAAIELLREAVALKSDSAGLLVNLGWACVATERYEEALERADAAIRLDENFPQGHALRAAALFHLGELELSLQSTQRLLALQPDDPGAHSNAAVALERLGRFEEAVAAAHRAIELSPNHAQAHDNLGAALTKLGRTPQAKEAHRRALVLAPDLVSAWINLAYCCFELGDVVDAEAAARRATELAPQNPAAFRTLGAALQEIGRLDEAAAAYEKAIALLRASCEAKRIRSEGIAAECDQLARARLLAATMLPPVYESQADLERWRQRLIDRVKQLHDEKFVLELDDDPAPSLLQLAYQGKNDVEIQRDIAALIRAPKTAPPLKKRSPGKTRVTFISRFLRNHTIGRLNAGLIENLNRDEFDVSVISIGRYGDTVAAHLQESVQHHICIEPSLAAARHVIAGEEPDILFFTDIGMEPVTYSLAHFRLAPTQCVTWGHPLTTGIDTVDYFVSSELLEIPEAQQHYTEQLVRLPSLAVYYDRPVLPATRKTRADFGLAKDAHVYGCLQSVWKFHPEFDELLAEILRRDRRARLVILSPGAPLQALLMKRLTRTLGEGAKRVQFVPQQKYEDFLTLTSLCDVMLDPIHFGGGNTSYESFAFGVPIVTLPSQFLRGRITAAQYKMMGVEDGIATSREDYVARAVAIGSDRDRRRAVSEKILAANDVLYENLDGVRQLEEFFKRVATRGRD